MVAAFYGLLTGIVIIILTVFLAKYFSAKLMAATMLCAIAFIYVGFSLQGNPVNYIILEVSMALLLYFVAIIGYTKYPSLIGYGIVFHGVWDVFHHHASVIETSIPAYWPSFCGVIDLLIGIYFILYFNRQNRKEHLNKALVK